MKKFVIAMVVIILLGAVLTGIGCAVFFSSDWRWGSANVEYFDKTFDSDDTFSTIDLYLKNSHNVSFVRGDKCTVEYVDTDIAPISVSVQNGTLSISEKGWDALNWFKRIFYKLKTTDIVITVPESCPILDIKGTVGGAIEINLPNWEYGKIDLRVSGAVSFVANEIKANRVSLDVSGAASFRADNINVTSIDLEVSGAAKMVLSGTVNSFKTRASGSVNMQCNSFVCPQIDIHSSGSSEITLSGTGSELKLDASGSGKLWARNFTLDRAEIEASGSVNAELNVSTYLKVDTSGSSNISYWGNPHIEKSTSGSSSIVQRG